MATPMMIPANIPHLQPSQIRPPLALQQQQPSQSSSTTSTSTLRKGNGYLDDMANNTSKPQLPGGMARNGKTLHPNEILSMPPKPPAFIDYGRVWSSSTRNSSSNSSSYTGTMNQKENYIPPGSSIRQKRGPIGVGLFDGPDAPEIGSLRQRKTPARSGLFEGMYGHATMPEPRQRKEKRNVSSVSFEIPEEREGELMAELMDEFIMNFIEKQRDVLTRLVPSRHRARSNTVLTSTTAATNGSSTVPMLRDFPSRSDFFPQSWTPASHRPWDGLRLQGPGNDSANDEAWMNPTKRIGGFVIGPLKSWGRMDCHDCFDIYKPVNTRYPTMSAFDNIQSPVVRVVSAAVHSKFTSIWREVRVQNAEEIYHWGQVYDRILARILFNLSQLARNSEYRTEINNDIWKIQSIPMEKLVGSMIETYTRKYGEPQWASSKEDVMMLIHTFDSCCSRPIDTGIPGVWPRPELDIDRSDIVHIAMKFNTEYAFVRRYMRQIVIDPSHKYVVAGENLGLAVSLWDPHQSLQKMKTITEFFLEPEVPWLKWDSVSGSFVGRVPVNFVGERKDKGFPISLDLGIVARTMDPLPQGAKREATVRANVCLWVYEPEEDDGLFEISSHPREGEYKFRNCSTSTCGMASSHQHPSPVSSATVGKTITPIMAPIQAKKPKKARHEDLDETSYDTDLSGSEACFVSNMQSDMIPGLGSCTRLLDSVRAPRMNLRPQKIRANTMVFNPEIHEDPHAGLSYETQLPSPSEFHLDPSENKDPENSNKRDCRHLHLDPHAVARYLQETHPEMFPNQEPSYYVVPPPTESESGTVHRQGGSDTSSILNGYDRAESIIGSFEDIDPSGSVSGRKTRRAGDYDISHDTSIEWDFLMRRGQDEDESVDIGDMGEIMKMKEEDWCMSSKMSVATEDTTYQFDRKDLRH